MTSTPTTEIAQFDRMVVSVYANDHGPAHVHVLKGGKTYELVLPYALPEEGTAGNPRLERKIREWLILSIPGTGKHVADLVGEASLNAIHHRPQARIPTPDEIRIMKRQVTGSAQPAVYLYAIASVRALPNYCVEITFENGEKRVVDIQKMRGDDPLFKQAFENFDAVKSRRYWIEWPIILNGKPNWTEIEDQDLWNAGRLGK